LTIQKTPKFSYPIMQTCSPTIILNRYSSQKVLIQFAAHRLATEITMNSVSEVDAANWKEEVSDSSILTVVYFWHEQCPYCFRFGPIIGEVAQEYKERIKFAKLNILENPTNQEIATNFGIMSTPTLLFLCKGRPVGQVVGLLSKEDLESVLEDTLRRYKQCLTQSTELRPAYIV
jgi:thioredoxin 1